MQFGEDWPGVFIRGDMAGWCALLLAEVIKDPTCLGREPLTYGPLLGLQSLLASSRVVDGKDPEDLQRLRPFPECLPR